MPIVFAAIGSGRPKPSPAEVCKHAAHVFKRIKIPRTKILRNP